MFVEFLNYIKEHKDDVTRNLVLSLSNKSD